MCIVVCCTCVCDCESVCCSVADSRVKRGRRESLMCLSIDSLVSLSLDSPPEKLLGDGLSTPVPLFCLICTIISSWILPLRVPPSSAAFSFFFAGSHNLLPFSPLFG